MTSFHEHVQERIRRLLEVVAWRGEQHESDAEVGEGAAVSGDEVEAMQQQKDEERIDEGGKRRMMMKGAKLVGRALEDVERCNRKKVGGRPSFFDCNICLSTAEDPVLTCCGHIFCWPCFYHLPCSYANAKECPACGGEVIETNIIPIYGNANANADSTATHSDDPDLPSSILPPRPPAPRISRFTYHYF